MDARARIGECVQVQTTNQLHLDEDPSKPIDHVNRLDGVYMTSEETGEVSTSQAPAAAPRG